MPQSIESISDVKPIFGAIRIVPVPPRAAAGIEPVPRPPFITISRQPGAGARALGSQLAIALNASLTGELHWTCWDRELVEKVAADLKLSTDWVESIENEEPSWFRDFLDSLSFSDSHDQDRVYMRVVRMIRSLAQRGRAIIVGRGGVFVTRKMPGGIHLRLVAPLEHRIAFMQREYHLTPEDAAAQIKQIEHNRHAFYHRYWPSQTLSPETFSLTMNTAELDVPTMTEMATNLVHRRMLVKS